MQSSVATLSHFRPLLDTAQLVSRECGQDALNALLKSPKKLVYLEAAPGYGKSCVMTQLYELVAEQQSVAWLALSAEHSEPRMLLKAIAQATQHAIPGAGRAAEALMSASDSVELSVVVSILINELHTAKQDAVLFLDNLEHAMDADALAMLADIVENTHQQIKFVFASRAILPRCFERLRPYGQLCHIPQEAFRLSLLEASSLMKRRYGIELPGDQVNLLLSQIDAWPLALNLYCESVELDSLFKPEVLEHKRFVDACRAYFEAEVHADCSPQRWMCLLELAQLNVITAALCDDLHIDCRSVVAESLGYNQFLFPLDTDKAHRFHQLFLRFLRAHSTEIAPQRITEIHALAFDCSYEEGNYQEAIFHALESQSWQKVVRAIEFFRLEIMTHNQLLPAAGWIAQLPVDIVKTRPKLLLTLSWSYALQGAREAAAHYLSEIDSAGAASLRESEEHDIELELDALNCVIKVCRGRYDELVELCERYSPQDIDASNIFRNVQTACLVYALFSSGHHDEAHRLAVKVESGGDQMNLLALAYRRIFRGMAYRLDGRLRQARAEYEHSMRIAATMVDDPLMRFSVADALLSEIHYEWGELDEAKRYLPLHAVLEKESVTVEPIIAAYLTSARIAADEGALEVALDILAQGESYGCREGYDRVIASMLGERVILLLRQNNIGAVTAIVAELDKLAEIRSQRGSIALVWSDIEYHRGISVVLLEQRQGVNKQALTVLAELAEKAQRASRVLELVKITMLEAVSYEQSGKHKTALRKAAQAIGLASEGMLLRSFCGLGDELIAMLCKALKAWDSMQESVTWSGDAAYISRLKNRFAVPEVGALVQAGDMDAIEQLSAKDTALLRYLGEGLKNREIAQAMSLSENTIAWHLKNLYGKLHASNRTSAVNIARQLRLI